MSTEEDRPRKALTKHPPSRCSDAELARELDRDGARYFTCARCGDRICAGCEGSSESDLCDPCWFAVVLSTAP